MPRAGNNLDVKTIDALKKRDAVYRVSDALSNGRPPAASCRRSSGRLSLRRAHHRLSHRR
jgi:hypothetical protein